jgi:hypothetical protein
MRHTKEKAFSKGFEAMEDQRKMDAILAATPWRCFHCDFITTDAAEAEAHFGDRDDASEFKPVCRWWASLNEDERLKTFQDTLRDLSAEQRENQGHRVAIEGLEYQVGTHAGIFNSYRPFRNCSSMYEGFLHIRQHGGSRTGG